MLFSNTANPQNLLPHNGELYYYPQFFSTAVANELFDNLTNTIAWKQEPIVIFGKQLMQPRLTALYGDPAITYGYSGITMQPIEWTTALQTIKQAIEPIAQTLFTTVLLNNYRNGNDSMGWHRDNEPVLGKNPLIASVSFGAARKFNFRDYETKKTNISLLLEHGSLLIMKGATNHFWEHQLPKTKQTNSPRINLTFRTIVNHR